MSCLGGTPAQPLPWIRFRAGGVEERIEGRWCERQQPFTSRQSCSSCPAYRGVRWDGTTATGLAPNGDLIALRADEYAQLVIAREKAFEDDDFSLLGALYARLEGAVGERTMRENGDPDAQDRWAAYMREYRARMDQEQRDRAREKTRQRVARHRARRRAACNVSSAQAP